jgi:crotonobetainyl-CoA:carnitine CoA-transferase CaiB-like acyl-CoA transferase
MIDSACKGTRVIEIASGIASGVAGRFFADLGADVVRFEQVDRPLAEPAELALRAWARAGKRTVDLGGRDVSLEALTSLLEGADLLISDLGARRWSELFPSPEDLVAANPGLVLLDLTRTGRVGPYADFECPDLVSLALSGYLFMCGLNSREPLRVGIELTELFSGVNAVGGALIALHHARRTGQGQVVEGSTLRTMLGAGMSFPISYAYQGMVRRRAISRMSSLGALVPCSDGHAFVSIFRIATDLLFILLGDERLRDPRFDDFFGREEHQAEMVQIMREAATKKSMREVYELGQELRMQNAMVQSPRQTPTCPQHAIRRFFQPLLLNDGRTIQAPVTPLVPVEARGERLNARGEVLAPGDSVRWKGPAISRDSVASPGRKALEGLKVLELTFAWAGPMMGRVLADHGAQVVKVESRKYVDSAKGVDMADLSFGESGRWTDRSLSYIVANPGKYHLAMELTDAIGREVVLDLVRWADVVIENFTPRVLPNLGLGWELFREVNPSLIMISATGFGHTGPYRNYGAWGWGMECQSGITFHTGYGDDPDPLVLTPTVPDPLSAATGVAAVLAALEERRRTGLGQWIDLSQYECASFATLVDIMRSGESGRDRPRVGNRHAWRAPQGVYPCDGADGWVALALETDDQWRSLCGVIGRIDLAGDATLATHAGRHAHHDRIDEAISAWTRTRTKHAAMRELQAAGVPAGAVLNAKDLSADPHVQAMDYFRAAWGLEIGLRIWPGPGYDMSATPGDVERGTSVFGEDNERVLRDLLGYDAGKVEALLATDAFSTVQDGLQKPEQATLPIPMLLERGSILSWDDQYRSIPGEVARANRRWREARGLLPKRFDGRDD